MKTEGTNYYFFFCIFLLRFLLLLAKDGNYLVPRLMELALTGLLFCLSYGQQKRELMEVYSREKGCRNRAGTFFIHIRTTQPFLAMPVD